tara:strand:- start:1757 stop:1915 length:159 start_codon:yes stop_codon:yes gene_type:complete
MNNLSKKDKIALNALAIAIGILGAVTIEYFDQATIGVVLLMWSNNISVRINQ